MAKKKLTAKQKKKKRLAGQWAVYRVNGRVRIFFGPNGPYKSRKEAEKALREKGYKKGKQGLWIDSKSRAYRIEKIKPLKAA